jgi:transposase
MNQSSTLYIGLDVHKDSIAVAYVAKDHDAEVIYLGTIGTRHVDIDRLLRKFQSKATHLIFVEDPRRCGDWLSRDRTQKGHPGWVVAPSWIPKQAGDRVKTDRRDAVPRERLMCSGDLTPVYVPTVEFQKEAPARRRRHHAVDIEPVEHVLGGANGLEPTCGQAAPSQGEQAKATLVLAEHPDRPGVLRRDHRV